MRKYEWIAGALAACGCSGAGPQPDQPPPPQVVRLVEPLITIAPGAATLHLEPKTLCTVNGGRQLRGTSPTGNLYLNAKHPIAFDVVCTGASGVEHLHPVRVDASKAPELAAAPDGPIRPALARDPASYTDTELVAAHYPRRPTDPARYQRWLADVTSPKVVADPMLVPSATRPRHDPMTVGSSAVGGKWSPNWGGLIMNVPGAVYLDAQGTFQMSETSSAWDTPDAISCLDNTLYPCNAGTDAAFWVGIDGSKPQRPIIQAGIESTWGFTKLKPAQGSPGQDFLPQESTEYWVWTEYFPGDTNNLDGYQTNPGDLVFVEVSAVDGNWNLDVNGGYGGFYISVTPASGTLGWIYSSLWQAPNSGWTLVADTAEWIMEKPTHRIDPFPGTWLDPLSHWSYAHVTDVQAITARSTQDLNGGSFLNMQLCSSACSAQNTAPEELTFGQLPTLYGDPMLVFDWSNY